ncbi:MAG: DUF1223 domain-containing protein [Spirochaetia bacterium]
MRIRSFLFPLVAAASVLSAAQLGAESTGMSGGFAVVELFTSEGCSSCPPADEALTQISAAMAKEKLPVYALEWHVDYWDYLGWKDPYDSHTATDRQYAYSRSLPSSVYTPQMVINGTIVPDYAGNAGEIDRTVRGLLKSSASGSLRLHVSPSESSSAVMVHAEAGGAPAGTKLLLLLVEDGLGAQPNAGENAGRRLSHSNVVRSVTMLPAATGDSRIQIPSGVQPAQARLIGLLQDERTMRIIAADQAPLPAGAAGKVSGRVIGSNGRAIAGAMIQACSGTLCVPALTDDSGTFVFSGLAPGRYSIAVDPGVKPLQVTLTTGQPFTLSVPIVVPR